MNDILQGMKNEVFTIDFMVLLWHFQLKRYKYATEASVRTFWIQQTLLHIKGIIIHSKMNVFSHTLDWSLLLLRQKYQNKW